MQADETGQRNIVADRNGYRLGESADLKVIEEMVKGENEAFTNSMRPTVLIASVRLSLHVANLFWEEERVSAGIGDKNAVVWAF